MTVRFFRIAYDGGMSLAQTTLPPQDFEQLTDLAAFLGRVSGPAALVGPDGQTIALPQEVFEVLADVARAMSNGQAISVVPVDLTLTTQEAANFLGISRPTLVRILERGDLPFQQPGAGRHRRVQLRDLLEYRERTSTARRKALDELTADTSEAAFSGDQQHLRPHLRAIRRSGA